MSKVFRRPMFRKGGNVGEGIMTGIRDNFSDGSTSERLAAAVAKYPSQALDPLTQFLIQGGLKLVSQPTTGGGVIADVGTALQEPTSQLMSGLAKKGELERDIALQGEILDIEGDIKRDVAQIQQRGALDIKKEYLDNVYNIKRSQAAGNQELLKQIEQDYQNDLNLFIVKGFDVSDVYNVIKGDEVQSVILGQAEAYIENTLGMDDDDPRYPATLLATMAEFTKKYGEKLKEGFASGGRVGRAMGTPNPNLNAKKLPINVGNKKVENDPTMDISYEELRTRLPKEISDEVVVLLSTSYEALADFAELRTQADVDTFNSRYGVDLILPQEA
jgi:hypothetical protein